MFCLATHPHRLVLGILWLSNTVSNRSVVVQDALAELLRWCDHRGLLCAVVSALQPE
jgi:hypothetical protein